MKNAHAAPSALCRYYYLCTGDKIGIFSSPEIKSQGINLLYAGKKVAAVLSLLFSVSMAPRCFTDDAKVNKMSSCSVAKFMLTTREGRGRLEARRCHFCIRGLSLLPAFVTLSPFRPLVLVCASVCMCVCVCVCVCLLLHILRLVCMPLHISSPRLRCFLAFL